MQHTAVCTCRLASMTVRGAAICQHVAVLLEAFYDSLLTSCAAYVCGTVVVSPVACLGFLSAYSTTSATAHEHACEQAYMHRHCMPAFCAVTELE